MADDLSPLVNLDLINKIYKTINAQINERVYDPQYNTAATLGSDTYKYVGAYLKALKVEGSATITGDITSVKNVSANTFNNLTLESKTSGFKISGGASKALTIADTTSISKPLTVEAATNISAATTVSAGLTVSAATNITKSLTVNVATTIGATNGNTGAVEVKSAGANKTIITGPDNGSVTFTTPSSNTQGTVTISDNSTDPKISTIGISAGKSLRAFTSVTIGDSANYGDVTIKSSGTKPTTIVGPNNKVANFLTRTTIGSTENSGDVDIQPSGTNKLTINGPKDGVAVSLIGGDYTTSATTSNNTTPTEGNLLKIKKISANQVLIGPTSDGDAVPTYRKLASNDLPTVPCSKGGTNITSYNKGDILYASANNTLSALSKGSDGQVLKISNGVPTWGTDNNDNTKNTAGANSTTEKIYLIGAKSQGDNPQTYSDKNVYAENGNLYASAVHNAVWNDLADCIEVPEDTNLEYGYCYSWNGDRVEKTSRKSRNCIGIHSNTAGLFMGEKPVKTIQAAVAGFALAYIDKIYPEGTPLTWSDDGKLTKCSLFKRLAHPERVIATFYKEEKQESWYSVKVNNRHWVKVK